MENNEKTRHLGCPLTVECETCGESIETMGGFAPKGEIDTKIPNGWERRIVRNREERSPPFYDHLFWCPQHKRKQ